MAIPKHVKEKNVKVQETETTTRIQLKDKEVILLGTAHISKESTREVREIMESEAPDLVCVEIDASRYASMTEKKDWSSLNITEVIKQKKGFLLLANLVLSSFQRRMGSELGIKPGEEMMEAVNVAQELDIPYIFADREVQVTLRRAWAASNFWNKNKLFAVLISSIFSREKLTEEEIEKLKKKSALEDMMDELASFMPSVKEVLIDERDQFLATKIYESQGEKVLAVIGAGHGPGITRWLKELDEGTIQSDLSTISSVPPPSKITKFLPWIVPAIVVGIIITGFITSGWEVTLSMLGLWVLANGSLSALGCLIALAHPLTIVASFLAAPITSMNPTIGVGIVSGLLEAVLKKPRVTDFETLHDDIVSIRGFYRNRFTHVLLVFFFSTIGSAIGTFIGIPFLSSLLF